MTHFWSSISSSSPEAAHCSSDGNLVVLQIEEEWKSNKQNEINELTEQQCVQDSLGTNNRRTQSHPYSSLYKTDKRIANIGIKL